MDHLPHLTNSRESYRIPYLESPDGHSIAACVADYPLARIVSKLENDEIDHKCDVVIEQTIWHDILQAFHDACGIRYDRALYVCEDTLGKRLSSAALHNHFIPCLFANVVRPQVLETFGKSAFELEVLDQLTDQGILLTWRTNVDIKKRIRTEFTRRISAINMITNAFFRGITRYGHREETKTRYRSIVASIVLVEYIQDICFSFFLDWPSETLTHAGFVANAHARIRLNGRCVSRISNFARMSSLLFLAWMLPNVSDGSHRECQSFVSCAQQASANVVSADDSHSQLCDGACDILRVDPDQLNTLVRAGRYAVIPRLPNDNETTIELNKGVNGRFVAISHVWSHGLGNPKANSMRRCHLRRIFELACSVKSETAIWIDTLCVPPMRVFPEEWRLALNRMRNVYQDASKVLVIDRQLDIFVGTNIIERQVELLLCDWMHRLWTLQEMLLPKAEDLFIVFSGEVVPITELLKLERLGGLSTVGFERLVNQLLASAFQFEDTPGPDVVFRKPVADIIQGALTKSRHRSQDTRISTSIRDLRFQQDTTPVTNELYGMIKEPVARASPGIAHFGFIACSLSARGVTDPSDEAICFATLMNIDLEHLPNRITFESIWSHLGMAPTWLLHTMAARLETQGFRWTPSTFLGSPAFEDASVISKTSFGAVTEHGLLMECDILAFQAPPAWMDSLPIAGARVFLASCDSSFYFVTWPTTQRLPSSQRLALVPYMLETVKQGYATPATLVQVKRHQGDLTQVARICSGVLQAQIPSTESWDTSRHRTANHWPAIDSVLMADILLVVD